MITDLDELPFPDRHQVDAGLVRRLIARQFPRWADLPVSPVAKSGWDNQTFHLGDAMSVRLPTASEYALAVEKEHQWLPVFAPRLPLRIPAPLALGKPDEEFGFPWSVYEWVDGETARADTIDDLTGFAESLAAFLVALRRIDPAGAPGPGLHNWFRGGPLRVFDGMTRRALGKLGDRIPRDAVTRLWDSTLRNPWDGRPVWFHGDIAHGNLLVRQGKLAAVIDFGTCGAGDPACDLAIAWTLLSGPSREAFRAAIGVDDGTWLRGQGWALWKALTVYAGSVDEEDEQDRVLAADARRVIDELLRSPDRE